MKEKDMSTWTTLSYSNSAAFGDRIFVNIPWRAQSGRSNRLTAWVTPVIGKEDEPGAWRFQAKSGQNELEDVQTAELLAALFTLLAAHGHRPERMSFSMMAALAQRPQHHISDVYREAARLHIVRQRKGRLTSPPTTDRSLLQ